MMARDPGLGQISIAIEEDVDFVQPGLSAISRDWHLPHRDCFLGVCADFA